MRKTLPGTSLGVNTNDRGVEEMSLFDKIKDQFVDQDVDGEEEYAGEGPDTAAPSREAAVRPAARPAGRAAVPVNQARPYTMIVVNPKDYKDAEKIGDHIKQGRPVVMNMENTDQDVAQRIVDFVQGVMYALDGHMDRISDTIYLCAPNNMTVSRESFSAYAAPVPGDAPQWNIPKA